MWIWSLWPEKSNLGNFRKLHAFTDFADIFLWISLSFLKFLESHSLSWIHTGKNFLKVSMLFSLISTPGGMELFVLLNHAKSWRRSLHITKYGPVQQHTVHFAPQENDSSNGSVYIGK